MAFFCVSLRRGINIPLLFSNELTSNAAEGAGLVVPIPI